jgi:hypothetical protein
MVQVFCATTRIHHKTRLALLNIEILLLQRLSNRSRIRHIARNNFLDFPHIDPVEPLFEFQVLPSDAIDAQSPQRTLFVDIIHLHQQLAY